MSINKCDQVDRDTPVSDVMNNVDEVNKQKVEIDSKSDVDLIPKDTGWAWMCCLGNISPFLYNVCTLNSSW